MSMYCRSCGKTIEEDTIDWCPSCGPKTAEAYLIPPKNKKKKKKTVAAVNLNGAIKRAADQLALRKQRLREAQCSD